MGSFIAKLLSLPFNLIPLFLIMIWELCLSWSILIAVQFACLFILLIAVRVTTVRMKLESLSRVQWILGLSLVLFCTVWAVFPLVIV